MSFHWRSVIGKLTQKKSPTAWGGALAVLFFTQHLKQAVSDTDRPDIHFVCSGRSRFHVNQPQFIFGESVLVAQIDPQTANV